MKQTNKITIGMVAAVFCLLCVLAWLKPAEEYSKAERRRLAQLPQMTTKQLLNGGFMERFESYALDQFPARDAFRSLKAITSLKLDNNGLYVTEGVINSLEYPLKENSLSYASKRFQEVYDSCLKDSDCQVYLSVIPDKNYFFAKENGYPAMDYERLVQLVREQNSNMTYIDIFDALTRASYYKTDSHWRQEKLLPVVSKLEKAMHTELGKTDETIQKEMSAYEGYEIVTQKEAFYGVYYGQAALPIEADRISYLTNEVIDAYRVFDGQNSREIEVYDRTKTASDDMYELFLGGPLSLVTIENEKSESKRELVIFRDSFGSSIAPLLAQGYAKTTLVDIRYMHIKLVKELVDFEHADVLFLYSTSVLNNSETLK